MLNRRGKWRPSALPLPFHLALDKGDWVAALRAYNSHAYSAPPLDTYDLLKTLLFKTGMRLDGVRQRFEAKVRMSVMVQRRQAELIEWHVFWEALNKGDSRNISMALSGARVPSVAQQIGVAEACAVLLHSQGRRWHETLVDEAPFATVTANNLVTIAASLGRWDLGLEMMQYLKIGRGDAMSLWQTQYKHEPWHIGLAFLTHTPAKVTPHAEIVPTLLEKGCDLQVLAHRLEAKKSLTNLAALTPLVTAALEQGDWDFVRRCIDHLVDIGRIAPRAHAMLLHLCEKHGDEFVFDRLRSAKIPVTDLTVELLEAVRFT